VAERQLDAGDRRLTAVLDALRVRYVEGDELAAFGDPELLFANVNTPDDLGRARARAGGAA
jgi:molybdopterin-guanine dinucleotide biosynthesis protein A